MLCVCLCGVCDWLCVRCGVSYGVVVVCFVSCLCCLKKNIVLLKLEIEFGCVFC